VTTITSRKNPVVATFRAAARTSGAGRQHLLLDGVRLIDDARSAGVSIEVAILSAAALQEQDKATTRLSNALISSGVRTLAATASVLDAISPVRTPSGAVALATHAPWPYNRVIKQTRRGLVVCPVGVQDPGNIGAIIRAADAGGAGGVVVAPASADPFGWRALRGAMGSTFRIPVAMADSVDSLVTSARRRGVTILAAVPRGGTLLYDIDLTGPQLLLVGAEGTGLRTRVDTEVDIRVSVPMRRRVDSLNVAVATALIIYEARRQQSRGTQA
jgi:TrmH family RNA methyltransferase